MDHSLVKIYLIVDRPLDKRFWSYWIFDLLQEIQCEFEVLQLTYVHDFLKESKETSPNNDKVIHVTKFLNESSAIEFLEKQTIRNSPVFLYTWAPPNAYMNVFSCIDRNFEYYYYLMHGLGDNASDHKYGLGFFETLKSYYKKIRFIIGMKRRFRGPRYWLDSTKMRINAQYPYLGPFGLRTKLLVTGNHFLERFQNAKNSNQIPQYNKDRKSVLWLDQNLPNVDQFGYQIKLDPEKYYRSLTKIFEHLIDLGYDVYLTLHPDTPKEDKDDLLQKYIKCKVSILEVSSENATINIDLVLVHDSTASYFGVLANKPIVNLMYHGLKDKLMIDSVIGLSRLLNTPLIYFDESGFDSIDFDQVRVDRKKYKNFSEGFILGNHKNSPYEYMKSLIKSEINSIKKESSVGFSSVKV
ncbi:polysialyltransferase family glycosyltransferase [Leptospira bouyouniensis]|uniref:polysialyltransferase family glycosyltransferase n=1 Tax=Leptospira bouyouniensis TaxID=2484911 RepID=UPI003CD0CAC3